MSKRNSACKAAGFLLLFISAVIACGISGTCEAAAQSTTFQSRGGASSPKSGGDSVAKPRKKGSAWYLTTPLGEHAKSTIDTLQYGMYRTMVPSMQSAAYGTTGTIGSEGYNMLFFDRAPYGTFFFESALHGWAPSLKSMKFYNVYTPMTLLSYDFGGGNQNHADRLHAVFAGNVNRNIGVGAFIDYTYSKGAYNRQAVKDFSFGFTTYLNLNRYEMQLMYYNYKMVNQENGGITDDLYVTDPGEVQGGLDKLQPKSIPINLSSAQTRLSGDRLFTTHAFNLGYWAEEQVNDTLTRDLYIPVTKFIYSLDYQGHRHNFINNNASQGANFWENTYLDPTKTDDNTRYWTVTNTIGVQLLEGFRKWAKFGISAYASLQTRRITQMNFYEAPELTDEQREALTEIPGGITVKPRITQNRLFAGALIDKKRGELIKYSASARFGLTGAIAGDLTLAGNISSRFRMLRDTVEIKAYGGFSNTANSIFLAQYVSNHFYWNQKLGKVREVKFGGELYVPWTKSRIKVGLRNLQNYVYFNHQAIPTQHSGNVQVFAATLQQDFKFGIWNWKNTLTYQTSSDQTVIPVPALALYSNMYLEFKAFKVLNIMFGVDCDYYTKFYGLAYQPATMSFHTQDKVQVGNYPFCNLYLSMKLYRARFYFMMSHINHGWFGKNFFSMPHYPLNPRCFQLGITIDFAN